LKITRRVYAERALGLVVHFLDSDEGKPGSIEVCSPMGGTRLDARIPLSTGSAQVVVRARSWHFP
jgi:hypothetical protein